MTIPLIGEIERWITEHASSVVLKEHLALLHAKLQLLGENMKRLEEENARLIQRNAELEQQAIRQQAVAEFVEARGALFKRLPNGGYSETPYCPLCHRTMSCFQRVFPYECSNKSCGHRADFKGLHLGDVLAGLPR